MGLIESELDRATGLQIIPLRDRATCPEFRLFRTRGRNFQFPLIAKNTPMNLQELKMKNPPELLSFAEDLEIENASSLRKQDMLFAILKQLAENDVAIFGDGVLGLVQ